MNDGMKNKVRNVLKLTERLPRSGIEKYSHGQGAVETGIPVIKKRDCIWVKDVTLSGDAPKGFVRLYEYQRNGKVKRNNPKTWPLYIAKTGHKWYPVESITEHLLNRLGCVFGIRMAESRLGIINGQLRFLSKYFLDVEKETLAHGAEIFAGYLEDQAFVERVEEANLSREIFTLQFVELAVAKAFPNEKEEIMGDLVKLLLFDAMVGNNDRHYYNWAVIQPFDKQKKARLSPIYDTARGLFWNTSDEQLTMRIKQKDIARFVKKYSDGSKPKLGWNDAGDLNHFRMVKEIYDSQFYITQAEIQHLFCSGMLTGMKKILNKDFNQLLSKERLFMINECLDYRYKTIWEVIQ